MKFFKERQVEPKKLPMPVLKCIPIDQIEFAPYQRELKMSKIRKIIEFFFPDIVGIPLISFRNGKYWCMGAQHRIAALKRMGYTEVWCQIITDLTYEEEVNKPKRGRKAKVISQ